MRLEIKVRSEVTIRRINPYCHSRMTAKMERPVKTIHSSSGPRSEVSVPGNAIFTRLMELILRCLPEAASPNRDREQAIRLQLNQNYQLQSKEIRLWPIGKIARFAPGTKLAIGTEWGCCYCRT